jgi:transcriptional regulator with XRE-family HTH domain
MLSYPQGGDFMLTNFGKFLRKLRIDEGEILKNMADRLGVSSAYLSAIEMGKRTIPDDMITRLARLYSLSEDDICQLESARTQSLNQIKLYLNEASPAKRDAALIFARRFDEMDEQTIDKLLAVMKNHSERDK